MDVYDPKLIYVSIIIKEMDRDESKAISIKRNIYLSEKSEGKNISHLKQMFRVMYI